MRTLIAGIVVAAAVAASAREAGAQGIVGGGGYAGAPVVVGAPVLGSSIVAPYADAYVPPYSYYAALPLPARQYVGLGASAGSYNDFPFHGQPYGHPYDAWTWPYIGRYPYMTVTRYNVMSAY